MSAAALTPLLLALATGQSTFAYDSYRPVGLTEFVERTLAEHPNLLQRDGVRDTAAIHPPDKIRTPVVYSGRKRAVSAARRQAMATWIHSYAPNWGDLYRQEIAVEAGGRTYWMTIQEALVPYLEAEIPRGSTVTLYAVFGGSINEELLFFVTEFKTCQPEEQTTKAPVIR